MLSRAPAGLTGGLVRQQRSVRPIFVQRAATSDPQRSMRQGYVRLGDGEGADEDMPVRGSSPPEHMASGGAAPPPPAAAGQPAPAAAGGRIRRVSPAPEQRGAVQPIRKRPAALPIRSAPVPGQVRGVPKPIPARRRQSARSRRSDPIQCHATHGAAHAPPALPACRRRCPGRRHARRAASQPHAGACAATRGHAPPCGPCAAPPRPAPTPLAPAHLRSPNSP